VVVSVVVVVAAAFVIAGILSIPQRAAAPVDEVIMDLRLRLFWLSLLVNGRFSLCSTSSSSSSSSVSYDMKILLLLLLVVIFILPRADAVVAIVET